MTPDHEELASLKAMKELLRRYVDERADGEPSRLAADLREVCELLLSEAARQGIPLDDVIRQYRSAIAKTARAARAPDGRAPRR
jgi:hypothetical protein